jgi:hypothetical protein
LSRSQRHGEERGSGAFFYSKERKTLKKALDPILFGAIVAGGRRRSKAIPDGDCKNDSGDAKVAV